MKSLVLSFAVLLVVATPALAKAPTLEELPTVKYINEEAKRQIEARRRAEEEAKKDPKMDLINAYADPEGAVSMYKWEPVVTILKDEKEEPKHREGAAKALRARFKDVKPNAKIRDVKKKISLSIVKLLVDNDPRVRAWVYGILDEWYPGAKSAIKYDPNEVNYPKRYKGYTEWRKYLSK